MVVEFDSFVDRVRSVQILSIDMLARMKEGLADRLSISVYGKLHDQAVCDACLLTFLIFSTCRLKKLCLASCNLILTYVTAWKIRFPLH